MKKIYLQPETKAIMVALQHVIAASEVLNVNSGGDALTNESNVASRRRSLWDDDEEEE